MKAMMAIGAAILLPLAAAAAQGPITRPGTVTHRAADASFPEQVGDFRRSNAHQFDNKGRDISATYNLMRPEGRLVITVYVYPAPKVAGRKSGAAAGVARATLCARQFEEVRAVIAAQYPGATPIEQGAAPAVAGVEPGLAHRSVFRFRTQFDGADQEVRSEADLYCYVGGNWLVKYRATSHGNFDAGPDVERFIRTGPWPGRALPESAGDSAGPLPSNLVEAA